MAQHKLRKLNPEEIKKYRGYKCGLNVPEAAVAPGTKYCGKTPAWYLEYDCGPTQSGSPTHDRRFLCGEHAREFEQNNV